MYIIPHYCKDRNRSTWDDEEQKVDGKMTNSEQTAKKRWRIKCVDK